MEEELEDGGRGAIREEKQKLRETRPNILLLAGCQTLNSSLFEEDSENLVNLRSQRGHEYHLARAAFMIPYMAIRLNPADEDRYPTKPSRLGTVMVNGAATAGLIGGAVCLISIIWALFGRMDSDFGSVHDRWEFLLNYLGTERLAYAFIWDIALYSIFQPWLIGANLANVQENRVDVVKYLRYIPVVGLVAYLLFMNREELYMDNRKLND